jgi:S-(hydroxymethyl)glutathione dehydrogenase/alcohol dehydrogenase
MDICEIELDSPAPREVLIRTAAAGLCHSNLHFMEGKYVPPLPWVAGHESSGIVEAVGTDVHYVKPGDHVVTCLSVFCGECELCLTGRPNLCYRRSPSLKREAGQRPRLTEDGVALNPDGQIGSFAEALLVHENALVKIDPEMPLDRAALLGCATTTGLGAVFNTAGVEPGSTVAIIGCGGVGLNVVQGAALAGASRVIAVDLRTSKLELARRFGATDVVDASRSDPVQAVIDLTGGGVEYAFEAIGLAKTAEQAFAMLSKAGTATVIGLIPDGEYVRLPAVALWTTEKKLQGSVMGSNRFRKDIPRMVQLYLQGRLNLDDLISARIGLEQINDGFRKLQRGEVARSVIEFAA